MSLEEEKVNQNEGVEGLLKENHKAELGKILVFGEKYKKEGEMMRDKFCKEHNSEEFRNLIRGYEESKRMSGELFLPEEKDIWNSLSEMAKEKFYREYLYEKIFYSGNIEKEYKGNVIVFRGKKDLKLFKEWVEKGKYKLEPGIIMVFGGNQIGDEGLEALAREWKDSLQPGMKIYSELNKIGLKGAKALAKEWKNKLQPGMGINLGANSIRDEGLEILAKEWKNSLQPGIEIVLSKNSIGDEGAKTLMECWKDSLQPGMIISLRANFISKEMKLELKEREQGYKNRGINCEVKL